MLERGQKHYVAGQVQPSSAIIVFDTETELVTGVSENISQFSNILSGESALGRAGKDVLGRSPVHDLRNAVTLDTLDHLPEFLGTWDLGSEPVVATTYLDKNHAVVELMPSKSTVTSHVLLKDISRLNNRIASQQNLIEMLTGTVRPLRILSGFDRLQVVSMQSEGTCKVLAESARTSLEQSVGSELPSPLEPSPAHRAPFRLIADTSAAPVDILCNSDAVIDLGLSSSAVPSDSRVSHLKDLGMQSELVQPIQVAGNLWGALVYQNRHPRVPSLRFRMVSSAIMDLLGATIFRLAQKT